MWNVTERYWHCTCEILLHPQTALYNQAASDGMGFFFFFFFSFWWDVQKGAINKRCCSSSSCSYRCSPRPPHPTTPPPPDTHGAPSAWKWPFLWKFKCPFHWIFERNRKKEHLNWEFRLCSTCSKREEKKNMRSGFTSGGWRGGGLFPSSFHPLDTQCRINS